jgi:hypothetical protein
MTEGRGKKVWLVMFILSILFIGWTFFTLINGNTILENGVKMCAGSSFDVKTIEERALGFMNMARAKPLWEKIWIGIIGLFCALGLKRKMQYAWILGIIWGAMILVNGLVQGIYEVIILNWSMACPQTFIFLVFGIVTLVSLLVIKNDFLSKDKTPNTLNERI